MITYSGDLEDGRGGSEPPDHGERGTDGHEGVDDGGQLVTAKAACSRKADDVSICNFVTIESLNKR